MSTGTSSPDATSSDVTLTAETLRDFVTAIVEAVGTPASSAAVVADLLVGSHLAGHDSHGVQHLPRYVDEVNAGDIVPSASPELATDDGALVRVRGHWGWGHVTAAHGTRLLIDRVQAHGIAVVSCVEVNHIGRLGHYSELAAAAGVVSIMMAGGSGIERPTAAPFGGRSALLAPNPVAMGFPSAGGAPVLVDFATTRVSGGKLALARARSESIAEGLLIDRDGEPTTDPNAWYDGGALLPFGEHKGFGVMVAAEILGRVLSGADDFSDTVHGGIYQRHNGATIIGIDAGRFAGLDDFRQRTRQLSSSVRAVPAARGSSGVMMPGDFEAAARKTRAREGIRISSATWADLLTVAERLGVVAP